MIKKTWLICILIIGCAIFDAVICRMAGGGLEPSLLPIKMEVLYFAFCVVLFIINSGIFKKNTDAENDTAAKNSKINRKSKDKKISEIFFLWSGILVLAADCIWTLKYTETVSVVHLANCNSAKLTGVTVSDPTAMAGYYVEQLWHIPSTLTIGKLLPIAFFAFTGFIFYCTAEMLCDENQKRAGIVFLTGTVLWSVVRNVLSMTGVIRGDVLDIRLFAAGVLPFFMVGIVFSVCCGKQMTRATWVEIMCIILSEVAMYLPAAVFCIVIDLSTVGYMVWIRYAGKIKASGHHFLIYEVLILAWLCLNPWSRENFWNIFWQQDSIFYVQNASDIPECQYFSDDYQDIVSAILSDGQQTKVLAPDGIMYELRARSLDVGLLYEMGLVRSENADRYYDAAVRSVHESMQEPRNKLGQIVQTAKGNLCNYLVLPLEADERWAMEQSGFSVIRENDKFVLYYCPVI